MAVEALSVGTTPDTHSGFALASEGSASQSPDLESQLLFLGIPPGSLSTSAKTDLQIVAGVALALGLTTAKARPTLERILELRKKEWALAAKQKEADKVLRDLGHRMEALESMSQHLDSLQKGFRDADMERAQKWEGHQQSIEQASVKATNYEIELKRRRKDLKLSGYSPELQHSELMQRSKRVQAKQREAEEMKSKLNQVKDLPPDMGEARLMYSKAKKKLEDLEEELSEVFSNFD